MTNPPPRVFAWGVGVATLYLAVAAAGFRSGAVPVRILFDGVAPPPPYRWARPPEELAGGNQAPEVGMGTVSLDATGSAPASAKRRAPASSEARELRRPLTVALRYATGGTSMLRSLGARWAVLPATRFGGSLHLLVASSETAGTFAAAAPQDLPYRIRTPWWWYALFLGIPTALALLIGFLPRIVAYLRRRPAS